MKPEPARHPLMIVFANCVTGIKICAVASLLVTAFWCWKFDFFHVRHKLAFLTRVGLVGIAVGLAILPFIHILALLLVRNLPTHAIRDRMRAIVILFAAATVVLFLVAMKRIWLFSSGSDAWHRFPFVFGACMIATLTVMTVFQMNMFETFSIPSNWITIVPILLAYLCCIQLALGLMLGGLEAIVLRSGLFRYYDQEDWTPSLFAAAFISTIILFVFVFTSGAIFPSHRRIAHLWRPERLPKIQPWTAAPAPNGHS